MVIPDGGGDYDDDEDEAEDTTRLLNNKNKVSLNIDVSFNHAVSEYSMKL